MSTKDQIFAAAKRAFDAGGLAAVSIRGVAKEVGITPMAIYRHYESADALTDALVMHGLARWEARVRAIKGRTPLERIERVSTVFLDFALEEPRNFEAAFMLQGQTARRYPDDFVAGRSPAGVMIVADVEQAIRDGDIAGAPPVEIWMTLWGLGQGLVSLHRAGRFAGGDKEFQAMASRMLNRTLDTFRTERHK